MGILQHLLSGGSRITAFWETGATVSGSEQKAETETLLEEVTLGRHRPL